MSDSPQTLLSTVFIWSTLIKRTVPLTPVLDIVKVLQWRDIRGNYLTISPLTWEHNAVSSTYSVDLQRIWLKGEFFQWHAELDLKRKKKAAQGHQHSCQIKENLAVVWRGGQYTVQHTATLEKHMHVKKDTSKLGKYLHQFENTCTAFSKKMLRTQRTQPK